jgi:hypothetical protein
LRRGKVMSRLQGDLYARVRVTKLYDRQVYYT